jgi:hypothetical protein
VAVFWDDVGGRNEALKSIQAWVWITSIVYFVLILIHGAFLGM